MLTQPNEHSPWQDDAAFSHTDLILMRGWSEFHGLTMRIDTAQPVSIALSDNDAPRATQDRSRNWQLWRDRHGVAMSAAGRAAHHVATVSEALRTLMPPAHEVLTDIHPTAW